MKQGDEWKECSLAQCMPQVIKCARVNPQSRPPSIYKPLKEIESLALSLGSNWGHRTRTREPSDARPPTSGALELATCPPLNLAHQTLTVTCEPPDATKWAPDAFGTHRSRAQRGLQTPDLTGLRALDASGAHQTHAQRGLQTALTPDAEHQTHSGASGALSDNLTDSLSDPSKHRMREQQNPCVRCRASGALCFL